MQIKLIFTTKVLHLVSYWNWEFLELGIGLFRLFACRDFIIFRCKIVFILS